MAPEGSRSTTWIIIVIIAVILAAGGFWYYQSSQNDYVPQELPVPGSTSTGDNGTAVPGNTSNSSNVNFGTVQDLPSGSSYPDVGK